MTKLYHTMDNRNERTSLDTNLTLSAVVADILAATDQERSGTSTLHSWRDSSARSGLTPKVLKKIVEEVLELIDGDDDISQK